MPQVHLKVNINGWKLPAGPAGPAAPAAPAAPIKI